MSNSKSEDVTVAPEVEANKVPPAVAANEKGLSPSAMRGVKYVGDAYGSKVQARVYDLAKAEMDSVDSILALIPEACSVVYESHFAGMETVEKNILDSTEIGWSA